jgi:hypothetical protein
VVLHRGLTKDIAERTSAHHSCTQSFTTYSRIIIYLDSKTCTPSINILNLNIAANYNVLLIAEVPRL